MSSYTISRALRRASPFLFQKRHESTVASLTKDEILILLQPPFSNWSNIIRDAEKVVGYPTSFMNLRCLLSDEFASMARHLRKLVGSNHLVMQTAKNILYGDSKNLQPWGLTILLVSKSVRTIPANIKQIEEKQRSLAELTGMIRTGHLIHRGIVNVPFAKLSKDTESAILGNKIDLLLGDYLIATAIGMLANLRNSDVSYMICMALKELSESEFFGERDERNLPLPGKPIKVKEDFDLLNFETDWISADDVLGKPRKEWTARAVFNGASLLGRGCQSAMVLNKQNRNIQNYAYQFGCNVALAWQAASEAKKLTESKDRFCLASAPVLFALEGNPDLYKIINQSKNDVKDVDYEDLKFNILKTDAIAKTQKLYEEHASRAIAYIDKIGDNESVNMIKRLINTS